VYERILVPTDDATEMERVFEHAIEIARPHGATVHVVSVVDERAFLTLDDDLVDDVADQLRTQGETAVQVAADRFKEADLEVETATLSGDPVDEIVRYANETGVDLVVMGTRRSNDNQAMLGSVSQPVTTRANSPVLIVDITSE